MIKLPFSNISSISAAYNSAWEAPSNIALVKYWGKKGVQLPINPSLSMTLKNAATQTSVKIIPSEKRDITFFFEGQKKPEFIPKIDQFLNRIQEFCPWVDRADFLIKSKNTFPHSAGIASSASSMAALALAIADIDEQLESEKSGTDFYHKASFLARLASGSASRSVFEGFSMWGRHEKFPECNDDFAVSYAAIHPVFDQFHDDVLITDSKPKAVSSSAGHELMNSHPFLDGRIRQAKDNFLKLSENLRNGDLQSFIEITENEALTLHALMMSSEKSFSLLKPETLAIIEAVRNYRKQSDVPVCFTLDAGPNVHLLYPNENKEQVQKFVKNELLPFCENNYYLEDMRGSGPKKLESYDA
ncbi:MAG TPA: diphosphomevalonate decarboxylase [Bacteroidales bacterium]|nr:diphosphomevalonate decarboxylase [Bacteroidales bacterium]